MHYKKYFSEHIYYFIIFVIVSFLYIVNGYASLGTNDDWALRGMLVANGVYGTLIMSYPLSYVISHLYDFFPTFQWYSILLTLVMGLNFYFFARYIQKCDSYIQKVILLILSLLWMTFLWFNMSITVLTITTMLTAIGLIRVQLLYSFLLLLIASLLRIDMMLIFMPYYLVSFFILRDDFHIGKKELLAFFGMILLVVASLYTQKQDKFYTNWLDFNKARASIVDMGILDVEKDYFTAEETFCIQAGWWQDRDLLSTQKLIETTPKLSQVIQKNIQNIHLLHFIKTYKFKHWLWLLLFLSLLTIILYIKNKKAWFMPFLVIGVILLLITRDVERVTVPLMMIWAFVLFESLRSFRWLSTLFLALFTAIFYYYASGQLGYRYFKELTLLQQEAHDLIAKNKKVCEASVNFPTAYSAEFNNVFQANFLFHENNWMQLNDKEILPTGWLSRNKFFYQTHKISEGDVVRKYPNYHAYLIDENTAFFGSKLLIPDQSFKTYLLGAYDKLYLKDKPNCKHKTVIIDTSEHFAISQIRVDCNSTDAK